MSKALGPDMSLNPTSTTTDRDCLQAWARRPGAESLRPVVERYTAFVYASALRRTGQAAQAEEVARAVFLVFARRARRMRKKTPLAGWLFHVTALACLKLQPKRRRFWSWPWLGGAKRGRTQSVAPSGEGLVEGAETTLWLRVASELDAALDRLPAAQRDAVLFRLGLNWGGDAVARILGINERRLQKRTACGLKKLSKRLRKRGCVVDSDGLDLAGAATVWTTPVPEDLVPGILATIEESRAARPSFPLARRILKTLAWRRWRRRLVVGVPAIVAFVMAVIVTAIYVDSRTGSSRLITTFLVWSVKNEARTVPGLAQPARPWPTNATTPRLESASVRRAADLYQTTNVWLAHLKFTKEQWRALEPKRIGPLPHFFQPDGTVLLRHPEAQRSGLAGVLGFDFNWARADLELGGRSFANVAARFKGNGTYLSSLSGSKRSFKVDLNRFTPGQKLGEVNEINLHNLIDDRSGLSDALAYEFFRDAGVPAPRTSYAYLTVSVAGERNPKPLGLYVMVEPVNEAFAAEWFGSKKTPIFKPVTYELFRHLGDDWSDYAAIYDLKTKATPAQQRRVMDFARLISFGDDAEFALRLEEFLELEEFARFLAAEVFLSCYDSFLSNGQNFYFYLDPRSNKFGFIPWDMDLAWGGFFLLGTMAQREQASIWHPWVGEHHFLERVMAVEAFQKLYRAQLEDFSVRLFVPERLSQRIDEVARAIRGPIAAESDFRLEKFEQAVSDTWPQDRPTSVVQGANRPVLPIKRFIANRARSVRDQLDGKSDGIILQRSARR
jgi:DNA-directed RNA polymerase specialized sigma24 family protein